MSYLASLRFWLATGERAAKTFAQTLAAALTVDGVFNVFATAWKAPLGIALGAALLSALTSVAGLSRLVGAADVLLLSNAAVGPAAAHCPRLDRGTLLSTGHHAG